MDDVFVAEFEMVLFLCFVWYALFFKRKQEIA
jgi:hypothetical protein